MTNSSEQGLASDLQTHVESERDYFAELLEVASPRVRAFLAGTLDDVAFKRAYTRHDVERANRIPADNVLNAQAVLVLARENDTPSLRLLCRYLAEEAGHERFFLEDLKRRGHDEAHVRSIPLTISTRELFGSFSRALDRGEVRPLMTWNLIIEQIAGACSGKLAERAGTAWGNASVKGAIAHVRFDETQDHENVMKVLVSSVGGERRDEVDAIIKLYGEYLDEVVGWNGA